jgi:endonuclease/exonuclease/phosphatase family metal-dependent hydrolase
VNIAKQDEFVGCRVPQEPCLICLDSQWRGRIARPHRNGVDGPLTAKEWGQRPIYPNDRAAPKAVKTANLDELRRATAQRRNGATAQRRNGATAQRRNGATAQRRNGATAHSTTSPTRDTTQTRVTLECSLAAWPDPDLATRPRSVGRCYGRGVPEDAAPRVNVVSLNTRGVQVIRSRLRARYAMIGAALEAGDACVACFQEVNTWWHLRLLAGRMRSFRHASFQATAAGPAGGLVTFSRLPVVETAYHGFGVPPKASGISLATRLQAWLKGALVTWLPNRGLRVINTHLVSNRDGDWSQASRFYPLHRAQLAGLAQVVDSAAAPTVVCGDFNIDRDSALFSGFAAGSGLTDVFEGRCPATFRAEYLPAGATPHCIDFILTAGPVKAESAAVAFAGKAPLPGGPGYVSDHIGLRASLLAVGRGQHDRFDSYPLR